MSMCRLKEESCTPLSGNQVQENLPCYPSLPGLIYADGEILYAGNSLKKLDRDSYRAKRIGVIFQSFNLLTNVTAVENIVLSMNISGSKEKDKKAFAYALLKRSG